MRLASEGLVLTAVIGCSFAVPPAAQIIVDQIGNPAREMAALRVGEAHRRTDGDEPPRQIAAACAAFME